MQHADNGDGSEEAVHDEMDSGEWEEGIPRGLFSSHMIHVHEERVGDYYDRVPKNWFAHHVLQDHPVLLGFIPIVIAALVVAIAASIVLVP